jgi:hypothetical protein
LSYSSQTKKRTANSGQRKTKTSLTAPVSLSIRINWNERQVQTLKKIINTEDLTRYLELYLRNAIVWSAVGTAIQLLEVTATEEE